MGVAMVPDGSRAPRRGLESPTRQEEPRTLERPLEVPPYSRQPVEERLDLILGKATVRERAPETDRCL